MNGLAEMGDAVPAPRADSARLDLIEAIVKKALTPLATRIDLEGYYPEEVLRSLGAAGAYVGGVASTDLWEGVQSVALVAQECVSTAFCMWCQDACAWYLTLTPNEALRESLLGPVSLGERLGGTALSNPLKAFAGIEPVRLHGTKVPDGYRVNGKLPFVSNLGPGHVFGAIFRTGDGRHVMGLFSTDMDGLESGPRTKFAALDGTRTWAIALREVFLPDSRILGDPAEGLVIRIRPAFILLQIGLALGLIRDCIAMIKRVAPSLGHVNRYLPEQAESLRQALAAIEHETKELCATPLETGRDFMRRVLQVRVEAGDWSIKAAHAALLHYGARGFTRSARSQRRLREAYFIAILTPAGKHLRKELAAL